jgi:hypothetical protein
VTAYPVPANRGHWWLTTQPAWSRLHAIPGHAINPADEDMMEALCGAPWPVLRAACGLEKPMTMPGVSSRLGMPRCGHCCRRLGLEAGNGTPANEAARGRSETAAAG